MKIAVRLDDITPDMDWERFLKFKALLDRYQVKPLIGVVPDNQDENLSALNANREFAKKNPVVQKIIEKDGKQAFADYVKELQKAGWCVAMHGYRHIYGTKKGGIFPLNRFSEFAGLPFETQKEMLEDGKKILALQGIETELFMAPAHSYDKNTLKALKMLGFTAITDGFGDVPYRWQGLKFYPISFQLSKTLQKKQGYSTMVVHTNTMNEKDYERYEMYFQNPAAEWISYKTYLEQPAAERGLFGRMKEFFMAESKYILVKLKSRQ